MSESVRCHPVEWNNYYAGGLQDSDNIHPVERGSHGQQPETLQKEKWRLDIDKLVTWGLEQRDGFIIV